MTRFSSFTPINTYVRSGHLHSCFFSFFGHYPHLICQYSCFFDVRLKTVVKLKKTNSTLDLQFTRSHAHTVYLYIFELFLANHQLTLNGGGSGDWENELKGKSECSVLSYCIWNSAFFEWESIYCVFILKGWLWRAPRPPKRPLLKGEEEQRRRSWGQSSPSFPSGSHLEKKEKCDDVY